MAAGTLETKHGTADVVAVVPSTGQKPVRFSCGVVPKLFLASRERERPESYITPVAHAPGSHQNTNTLSPATLLVRISPCRRSG